MVIDSTGKLITVGEAEPVEEGEWIIGLESTVTSRMSPGAYRLVTIALSKDVAMPDVLETPFIVVSDLVSYLDAQIATQGAEINIEIEDLKSTMSETQGTVAELKDSIESLEVPSDISALESRLSSLWTTTSAAIIVAIISIIVAIYAIISKK